jgi:hypothetical protein
VAPRQKETESRLSSLGVDGYDIGFNKDKTSYSKKRLVYHPS